MITKKTYATREAWLADRNEKPVLGSSDVGTIMGLNPYMTPYQYWMKQKAVKEFEEENENLYRGQFKEQAIALMFQQVTGEKVIQRSAEITVYKNDKYPDYVQVAPDRELFANGKEKRPGLECKDTRIYLPDLSEDNCPQSWYTQVQFQMGVMERDEWYVAAEEGNKSLVYSLFPFNPAVFDHIMSYCCDWFERHILGDEIPPIETGEDALIAFPVANPTRKLVGKEIAERVEKLKEKKAIRKRLDTQIEELEDEIKVHFEDNEALEFEGMILSTWKNVTTRRIDTTALKAAHPEIVAEFMKESITRKLLIK